MIDTLKLVEEFHDAFGLRDHTNRTGRPAFPSSRVVMVRLQGLLEEIAELTMAMNNSDPVKTLDALCDIQYFLDGTLLAFGLQSRKRDRHAYNVDAPWPPPINETKRLRYFGILVKIMSDLAMAAEQGDIVGAADALESLEFQVDVGYLINGLVFARDDGFLEVHRSNMSKLGPDGRPVLDTGGRVVKPPTYSPPNLSPIVARRKEFQP